MASTGESAPRSASYEELNELDEPDHQKSRDQLRWERDEWNHAFNQLIEKFPEPIFAVADEGASRRN